MMYPEQLREIGLILCRTADAKAMELITALVEKAYKDGYDDGEANGYSDGYERAIEGAREQLVEFANQLK